MLRALAIALALSSCTLSASEPDDRCRMERVKIEGFRFKDCEVFWCVDSYCYCEKWYGE